ncbi:MAG: hypothetical protein K2X82_08645 [Gemmataceae bacterium]|nr:hypothetical protein [Gemmataceae bacterium]
MTRYAVLVVGLAVLVAAGGRAQDSKMTMPEGTYTLVKGMQDGKPVDDMAKKAKYMFDGKKITIDAGKEKFVIEYKMAAGAKDGDKMMPIDMVMVKAPKKDEENSKAYGILAAKGDTVMLAYSLDKDARPKDFDGKKGFSFEFKKDKAK